jgi:hypothetical protein
MDLHVQTPPSRNDDEDARAGGAVSLNRERMFGIDQAQQAAETAAAVFGMPERGAGVRCSEVLLAMFLVQWRISGGCMHGIPQRYPRWFGRFKLM